jgi:hypothetical protein
MAWRAPFGKLAGGMIRICVSNQSVPACGEESAHKKTHKSEDAGLKDTFVFTIQAANLSFQSPHSAAKRRNLRAADHGRRWYSWVFAKVGQSIWPAPALSKGGGTIPLILICLEHPWQHTVRATIVLGQNLI